MTDTNQPIDWDSVTLRAGDVCEAEYKNGDRCRWEIIDAHSPPGVTYRIWRSTDALWVRDKLKETLKRQNARLITPPQAETVKWRAIIHVLATNATAAWLVIPSWKPDIAIRREGYGYLEAGTRFFAQVNIGALSPNDLEIDGCEIAEAPPQAEAVELECDDVAEATHRPQGESTLTQSYNIIAEWAGEGRRRNPPVTTEQYAALQRLIYAALKANEDDRIMLRGYEQALKIIRKALGLVEVSADGGLDLAARLREVRGMEAEVERLQSIVIETAKQGADLARSLMAKIDSLTAERDRLESTFNTIGDALCPVELDAVSLVMTSLERALAAIAELKDQARHFENLYHSLIHAHSRAHNALDNAGVSGGGSTGPIVLHVRIKQLSERCFEAEAQFTSFAQQLSDSRAECGELEIGVSEKTGEVERLKVKLATARQSAIDEAVNIIREWATQYPTGTWPDEVWVDGEKRPNRDPDAIAARALREVLPRVADKVAAIRQKAQEESDGNE